MNLENYKDRINTKNIVLILTFLILLFVINTFYLVPDSNIAKFSEPIINDNWVGSFDWLRENSKECAVVATYWDPGHFIQAIANRSVIFGGSTQNEHLIRDLGTEDNRLETEKYDNGIVRVVKYENNTAKTARIQDITAVMMTTNETLAVEILRDYVKPGCDEIYFLATSDLVQKSVWWTYFSTWSPDKEGNCPAIPNPKGDCYSYSVIQLAREDGNKYYYSPDPRVVYIVEYDENNKSYTASFQANKRKLGIKEVSYFNGNQLITNYNETAEIDGKLLIQSNKQIILHIPNELKDSMFTRLFFENGQGLNNFNLVKTWGGEVKLFRVNL